MARKTIGYVMQNYADLMFHDAVAEIQRAEGTFEKYQTFYPHRTLKAFGQHEIDFIQSRESVYISSVSPDGWPYVQHRGGPVGFLKVLSENRIVCADYRGNQQFISMGNLAANDKISMFCMDYTNKARLKLQGHATLQPIAEVAPEVVAQLQIGDLPAERVLIIDIVAMDWNCPKYIPAMFPAAVVRQIAAQMMGELQAENDALKAELARLKG
jgi:predicted pyridoxine 5'-phosphate oxidase superfamily flavin-nucleotide-binding protein